jgi:hypothetical protein
MRAREGAVFFNDEDERQIFLQSLADSAVPAGVTVYAYALMERNALLFLRSGDVPLSQFVHRTQAGYFNRLRAKNGRSRPRIRDRHRAILVEEGELFLPLVRRVHVAPIKGSHWTNESEARKWGEVSSNRWTSFPIYTGGIETPGWFGREEVLEKCRPMMPDRPVDGFYRYIIDGVKAEGSGDVLDGVVAMSLLGSSEFIERYYETAKGRRRQAANDRTSNSTSTFLHILAIVAEMFGVSTAELRRARSRHPGRKYVVELAMRHALDEGGVKALGAKLDVSGSALAHLRRSFRQTLAKNPQAREMLDQMERELVQM